ncbi:hypothetical protein [Nocardioides ultimimeridianus]
MSKLVVRAVLAAVLGAAALPFLSSPAHAATVTIHMRATAPGGAPLDNVRWNVFTQDATGTWDHGVQAGPLLTDADGWMSLPVDTARPYRYCFYDDDYVFNTRTQRYADVCVDNPVDNTVVTMAPDGLSLTVGHPWIDGTAAVGKTLTVRPGVWGPSGVALAYQWVSYDNAGNRTPIAGATGTTYTPTAADTGDMIAVEVTGTKAGYRTAVTGFGIGRVGGTTPTMSGTLAISGTAMPGNTLTAVTGAFVPSDTSAALAWYVDGKKVGVGTDVDSSSLQITPAMAGATIELDMTAYRWPNTAGECCTDQLYASAQVVVGGGVTGTTPTVSGSAIVGSTLTADAGSWGPSGVSLAYQWSAAGTPIAGATTSTYQPVAADRGKTITVTVTGTLAGGYPPVSRTSAATAAVRGVLTSATPTISGTPKVGSTLTANPGAWSPTPSFSYQWSVDGTPVPGATAATYAPGSADLGKAVTVAVTGALSGYVTTTKASAPTAAVTTGQLTAAAPTISGTAIVGRTLSAVTGTWSPTPSFTYQWLRAGVPIPGATGATYRLVAADTGKQITAQVTGTRDGYATTTLGSAPTAAVKGVFATAPTPTIVGTARVGRTLTAKPGTWSPGATLRYQWLRNGRVITGATRATYALVRADRGTRITVRVTGSHSGYLTVVRTSAARRIG